MTHCCNLQNPQILKPSFNLPRFWHFPPSMASLFRISRKCRLPSSFSLSGNLTHRKWLPLLRPLRCFQESPTQFRAHSSETTKVRSPFDSNIIRILRTEVEYQSEYAPPEEVFWSSFWICPIFSVIYISALSLKFEHWSITLEWIELDDFIFIFLIEKFTN